MNKKSILYVLLALIFIIIFNAIFFVAGGSEHVASVWISYGFIHFSYLMILITPFLIRKSSSAVVFGISLYSISSIYFFVEFIVGTIFIIMKSESYIVSLIVQMILLGVYAILFVSNMISNENTADSIERHEEEVAYIKYVSSRVKLLVGKVVDKKANREIEKVYDLLHSSPTRSNTTAKLIEEQIECKIVILENAVFTDDIDVILSETSEIILLTEERNRIINN